MRVPSARSTTLSGTHSRRLSISLSFNSDRDSISGSLRTLTDNRDEAARLDAELTIDGGKGKVQAPLTWNDKISFVLTEQFQIKRLAFLDILKEEAESQAETTDELFDLDFTLMTGELARLLADLVEALGGENLQQGDA